MYVLIYKFDEVRAQIFTTEEKGIQFALDEIAYYDENEGEVVRDDNGDIIIFSPEQEEVSYTLQHVPDVDEKFNPS